MVDRNIKLGLFVIIGIAIFAAGLYYIGMKRDVFGQHLVISAVFKNASGIKEGNNVRLAGIKVGSVKEVSFVTDSTVRVKMSIERDAARFVKKDAIAQIESEGLMGNKLISLESGTTTSKPVKSGDEIGTKTPVELTDIMNSVLANSKNIKELTANLITMSEKLLEGRGALGTLLFDETSEKKVNRILTNFNRSSIQANRVANNLESITQKIDQGEGVLGKLLMDDSVAREFGSIVDSLIVVVQNANETAEELSEFSRKLNEEDGTINRLISDKEMADNLEITIENARQRTAELEKTIEVLSNSWILNLFSGKKKRKKKEQAKDSAADIAQH